MGCPHVEMRASLRPKVEKGVVRTVDSTAFLLSLLYPAVCVHSTFNMLAGGSIPEETGPLPHFSDIIPPFINHS